MRFIALYRNISFSVCSFDSQDGVLHRLPLFHCVDSSCHLHGFLCNIDVLYINNIHYNRWVPMLFRCYSYFCCGVAPVLFRSCSGVVSMLFRCYSDAVPVLLRCCSGVISILFLCCHSSGVTPMLFQCCATMAEHFPAICHYFYPDIVVYKCGTYISVSKTSLVLYVFTIF